MKTSQKILFLIITVPLSLNFVFAQNGYLFNLYCKASDNRTLSTICQPATEGPWEYYGGSYNYQHMTPRYLSMDEVTRDMENHIDNNFNCCMPTHVSPFGPPIDQGNHAGLISIAYEMLITVSGKNGDICEQTSGTYANAYTQEKRFYCDDGAQGPFQDSENVDYRFCAIDKKFNIDISGYSITQALPSLVGPIAQTVTVTAEDGPAKNWGVQIEMVDADGSISYVGGVTNDQGVYEFIYVPPLFHATRIDLMATCDACQNTARKTITVLPADLEPSGEPPMCRR